MIAELHGSAILSGLLGAPPRDIDALAATISRISHMGWTLRDKLLELDINPLFVRDAGKGIVAGDALAVFAEILA
jgi:acetate---CoA ligase (ADP-forming)